MKASENGTTIVVTGSFNPAILQPAWVARYGLLRDPKAEPFQVVLEAPVADAAGAAPLPPRFRYLGLDVTLTKAKLVFHVNFADALNEGNTVCGALSRMLGELRHTPVTGFGLNFAFELQHQSEQYLAQFVAPQAAVQALGEGARLVAQSCQNQIEVDDYLLRLDSERSDNTAHIRMNFHRGCRGAPEAAELIGQEGRYARVHARAMATARALSAEDIEED